MRACGVQLIELCSRCLSSVFSCRKMTLLAPRRSRRSADGGGAQGHGGMRAQRSPIVTATWRSKRISKKIEMERTKMKSRQRTCIWFGPPFDGRAQRAYGLRGPLRQLLLPFDDVRAKISWAISFPQGRNRPKLGQIGRSY